MKIRLAVYHKGDPRPTESFYQLECQADLDTLISDIYLYEKQRGFKSYVLSEIRVISLQDLPKFGAKVSETEECDNPLCPGCFSCLTA